MTKIVRNIDPRGYIDVPLLGREGPTPYLRCTSCEISPDNDHEHGLLDDPDNPFVEDRGHAEPGSGCVVPGEHLEVDDDVADQLLALTDSFELVNKARKGAASSTIKEG